MPVDRSVWVVVRRELREDVNTYQNVMFAKIRNELGGNCQWLVSMFETNVIEASDILCRNFRSAP